MMQHIKRFFILFILIFISLFNYDYKVVNAQEETQENITFIHKSSRTASILISSQNIVYSWGLWGEASNVTMSKKYVTPTNISNSVKLNANEEFIDVFTGEQHCFLLTNLGRVFAMGSGENSQLGYIDYLFKPNLVEITDLFDLTENEVVRHIGCGDDFNIVLTSNNRVLSFGLDEDGQLGIGDNDKQLINDITNNFTLQDGDYIEDVVCGASHTLAKSNNGYLYVWGSNKFNQLGIKDVVQLDKPTLLDSIIDSVIKIACGRYSSYVLTNQAQLFGFGSDSHGQLATHDIIITSNKKETPYLMNSGFALESDEYIKDITAGYYFAIVKTNLNNYYSFGQNSSGQLANGSTITTSIPQKIEYKSMLESYDEIINISCGIDHCIATTKYGHILAWGSNLQSQLSEDSNVSFSNCKIIDITVNFPPIVNIIETTASIPYKNYILDVEVYYLSNQKINEIYYSITNSLNIPTSSWIQFDNKIEVKDIEGETYVHLKIIGEKDVYYYVSAAYFLDDTKPEIKIFNKDNEEIYYPYINSTVFVEALDNNNSVNIVYFHNGKQYYTQANTFTFIDDGIYKVYAIDSANNSSAAIEFTIDTILPTITKIDNNLIQSTTITTRDKQLTIQGSEALSCYLLGYKGVQADTYTAINGNESSFTINLKKGVNTLTIFDLAGNQSLTYEIIYSPRFFQDTQLLLIVFGSIVAIFVVIIIVVYGIRNKKQLTK